MTTPLVPQAGQAPPPTEAQGLRAEAAATKTTAKTIAHMIASKMQGEAGEVTAPAAAEEGDILRPPREPRYTTEPVATPEAATEQAQVQTPPAPVAEPVVEEDLASTAPDVEELTRLVEEAALDLGVLPSEVPTDLLPVLEKLVQSSVTIKQNAAAREAQAAEAVEQVEEFARQLKESPDRLLLTMALTQPEVFAKVVETFQEMQQDPRIKDLVSRELSAEARLREAERRERLNNNETVKSRTEKVINATNIAARKHGVPYELAEQFVASAITTSQGQFGPADVDAVVTKLANQIKAKAAPRRGAVRVATPAKVAATAAAPTTAAAGATVPPPAAGERTASAGLKEATPHGRLMDIVRSAGKRLRVTE